MLRPLTETFSQVMIRLEIDRIPEIHILTRWTRSAKDVVPEHMRFSATTNDMVGAITIWQRRLNTRALEACTKGNTCRETYDIVLRHLNAAIKEVDDFIIERKKLEEIQETETEEVEIITDVESANRNRYGASGSSAGLSDSEIQNLKAPEVQKVNGRPRSKRLMSSAEKGSRRITKKLCVRSNAAPTAGKKKQKKANAAKVAESGLHAKNFGLPYQTKFCTKCRKPDHTRKNCPSSGNSSESSKSNVRCGRCLLKGHNESECLVVDIDTGGYFR